MKLILPEQITDDNLTASNVPLDDATEWEPTEGGWGLGTIRMVTTTANGANTATFKIYVSQASGNTRDPSQGQTFDDEDGNPVLWWGVVSSVNRFKMFDEVLQDQTEQHDAIVVEFEPSNIVNSIALMNVEANTIRIEIEADPEGLVYDETFDLVSNAGIDNWWSYFNSPVETDRNLVVFRIPGFTGAKFKVTIEKDGAIAKCGALVIGVERVIGASQYFALFGIQTFSQKITDRFGRNAIDVRASSQRQEFPVKISTRRLNAVQRILEDVIDTPTVYVGDEKNPIYGFYQDFEIVVPGPVNSDCNLIIEAL